MEVDHRGKMSNEHITVGSYKKVVIKREKLLICKLFIDTSKFYSRGHKSRLRAGNSCYYLVQTLLSSRLLFKNLKNNITSYPTWL